MNITYVPFHKRENDIGKLVFLKRIKIFPFKFEGFIISTMFPTMGDEDTMHTNDCSKC